MNAPHEGDDFLFGHDGKTAKQRQEEELANALIEHELAARAIRRKMRLVEHAETSTMPEMEDAVGRPELDAKIDSLRQEMRADSAALRASFAEFGASMKVGFADIGNRLGTLESRIGGVEGEVGSVKASLNGRLDEISSKVSNFKWQVLGAAIAVVLAVWANSFTIQQMTVSTFQAAQQPQQALQPPASPAPTKSQTATPPVPAAPRP